MPLKDTNHVSNLGYTHSDNYYEISNSSITQDVIKLVRQYGGKA
jgi:hypothetical protein